MTAGQNDYFVLKVILFHKYLKGGVTNAKTKIHLVRKLRLKKKKKEI